MPQIVGRCFLCFYLAAQRANVGAMTGAHVSAVIVDIAPPVCVFDLFVVEGFQIHEGSYATVGPISWIRVSCAAQSTGSLTFLYPCDCTLLSGGAIYSYQGKARCSV